MRVKPNNVTLQPNGSVELTLNNDLIEKVKVTKLLGGPYI